MELETINYFKFVLALLFVLGLIGGFAIIAKRSGLGNRGPIVRGKSKRLSIIETMVLDPKRRVVLIQCDNSEHLLLLGTNNERVIGDGSGGKDLSDLKSGQPPYLKTIEKAQPLAG